MGKDVSERERVREMILFIARHRMSLYMCKNMYAYMHIQTFTYVSIYLYLGVMGKDLFERERVREMILFIARHRMFLTKIKLDDLQEGQVRIYIYI
jgi:hypothetical protein